MVPSPIEDKPPVGPPAISNKNGLQLVLENHITKNGDITLPTTHTTITNGSANTSYKKIIKNCNTHPTEASAASSNSSLNSATGDIPAVHGAISNTVTPSTEKPPKSRIANGTGKQTTLKR